MAENFQTSIVAPEVCPNCERSGELRALGYYFRNLTRLCGSLLRIGIRRFRCRCCRKTVSILPAFAQPHRIVQNITIEKFVAGEDCDPGVLRWSGLLRRYWQRFASWVPEMQRVMRGTAPRSPPGEAKEWWNLLHSNRVDFSAATQTSVSIFQITFFCRYRCHRPNPPAV